MKCLLIVALSCALACSAAAQESDHTGISCVERLDLPTYPRLADAARISAGAVTVIRVGSGGTIDAITSEVKAVEPVRTAFLKSIEDAVRSSRFVAACAGRTVTIEFQFSLGEQVGTGRVSFAYSNRFTIFAPAKIIQGFNGTNQDGQTANTIPILTVCDALRDPARYGGQVVIVVGRSVGTSEGSWLSENCGLKINAQGRTYSATISTAYVVSWFAPPPQIPKSFKWDKSALQHALDRVKVTTHLESNEHWGAVYGRLETAPTHDIKLRDGSVATIVGYGHLNDAPAQLVSPEGGFLRLRGK